MASNKSSNAAPFIKSKIKRTKRDAPPAHYIFKIESFTQFLEIVTKTRYKKYESEEFDAGDYKWKLVVYPNGNKNGNGEGHISMYIASSDQTAISGGCYVNALVNFFIYDHIRDKYLTIQDGKIKRYHFVKNEHGFDQLLSLVEFNDISNGYLVNDCCVFGAEVHVIKNTVKGAVFLVRKNPPNTNFTWKIDNFSTLENMYYESDTFNAGSGHKWKLRLYPKGNAMKSHRCLSLYLHLILENNDATQSQAVHADCKMLIKDQIHGKHHERILGGRWYRSLAKSRGYPNFMFLSDLHNALKGFLVNDNWLWKLKLLLTLLFKICTQ